jgi:hypothetical protein
VIAAPPPAATAERAQPNTKAEAGEIIRQLFGEARNALMQRAVPAPKKSRRKRSGDDEARAADLRKQIKRLFRKVRRHIADDPRDDRPTFDSQWFHQHQQRTAQPDTGSEHERGFRQCGPDYASPTL